MNDPLQDLYLEIPRTSPIFFQTVSNSETQAYLACEYKHYFAFGLGLRPKNHSEPVLHGILGHRVMEIYHTSRKKGLTHKESMDEALEVYHSKEVEHGFPQIILMQNMKRMLEYFVVIRNDEMTPVMVEEKVELELDASIYGFTADLLYQDVKGDFVLRDYKFVERFWNDNRPMYEPQLLKYVFALRKLGYDVRRAEYQFIKYVDAANGQHFMTMPLTLNTIKIQMVMQEHEKVANEIIGMRKVPISQWKHMAQRNLSYACERCPFKIPCLMELEGRDVSKTLRVQFEPGEYGYQR